MSDTPRGPGEPPGEHRGDEPPGEHRGDEPPDEHRGDELPDDLDVTRLVGPYTFPDIARRRIAAAIYAVLAVACFAWWLLSPNAGLLAAAIALALIAGYHLLAGWHLAVDETEALAIAARTTGFPVGHASAQLAWRGWRSRPVWRVLVYSADEPPSMRGLVELDGVDGAVLGEYVERNPEDWSQYGVTAPEV